MPTPQCSELERLVCGGLEVSVPHGILGDVDQQDEREEPEGDGTK